MTHSQCRDMLYIQLWQAYNSMPLVSFYTLLSSCHVQAVSVLWTVILEEQLSKVGNESSGMFADERFSGQESRPVQGVGQGG